MKHLTKTQLIDKVVGKPVIITFDRWLVMSESDEFVGGFSLEDASDILREASNVVGEREINQYLEDGMIGVKVYGDLARFFVLSTLPNVLQAMATYAPKSAEDYYGNTARYAGRYMGD